MSTNLGQLLVSLGVDTRQLNTAQKKMKVFEAKSTSSFSRIQKSVFSLRSAMAGLGVTYGFTKIMTAAKDYQTAVVDMNKVTNQSYAEMEKQIEGLSATLGNSTELMQGYYQTISAGVTDPKKALDLLTVASKTAKVAHVSQGDTVKALTKLMKGFQGQIEDVATASDLLLTIEKEGQTSVAELVPVIGDVSNVANMAGLTFQEMGASLSLISQTAGSTAEATTQLKALIRSTLKPTEQLTALFSDFNSTQEALQSLGLVGFLQRVNAASSNAAETAKILGGRQESIVAYSALMSNGFKDLADKILVMDSNMGALDRSWAEYKKSLDGVWQTTKAIGMNLMIKLGQTILPGVTASLGFLNENIETVIGLVKTLIATFAILKGMQLATLLAGIASQFTAWASLLPAAITSVSSFVSWIGMIGVSLNPAGMVLLGLGALVAVVKLTEKHFKLSKEELVKWKKELKDIPDVRGADTGSALGLGKKGIMGGVHEAMEQQEKIREEVKKTEKETASTKDQVTKDAQEIKDALDKIFGGGGAVSAPDISVSESSGLSFVAKKVQEIRDKIRYLNADGMAFYGVLDKIKRSSKQFSDDWKLAADLQISIMDKHKQKLEAQKAQEEELQRIRETGKQAFMQSLQWENQAGFLGDKEYLNIVTNMFNTMKEGLASGGVSNWSEEMRNLFTIMQDLQMGESMGIIENMNQQFENGTISLSQYRQGLQNLLDKFSDFPGVVQAIQAEMQNLDQSVIQTRVTMNSLVKDAEKALSDKLRQVPEEIGNAFANAIVNGKDLETSLQSLAKEISFLIVKALLMKYIIGPLMSGLGFSEGGVVSGGQVKMFAGGGVVSSPTAFPMQNGVGVVGEAGPEAIVPLQGGAIPVKFAGEGKEKSGVNITLINTIDQDQIKQLSNEAVAENPEVVVNHVLRDINERGTVVSTLRRG